MRDVLAIDIGASKASFKATTADKKEISQTVLSTKSNDYFHAFSATSREILSAFGARVPVVCIASAPNVDQRGVVLRWPNRADWVNRNVAAPFHDAGARVRIVDDGMAAAAWVSAHFGARDLVHLHFGSGIAVGVVKAGRAINIADVFPDGAGHIEHPSLGTVPCRCGGQRCVQANLNLLLEEISANKVDDQSRARKKYVQTMFFLGCVIRQRYNIRTIGISGLVPRYHPYIVDEFLSLAVEEAVEVLVTLESNPSLEGAFLLAEAEGSDL